MKAIELILSREGESIRISLAEQPKHTLRTYEEKAVSFDTIDSLCSEIISILNRANRRGDIADRLIADLKKAGQDLFDELMTPSVKKTLSADSSGTLSLDIDDRLMHIPWELLFDGENFLCRKFNVGRIISTKQTIQGAQRRMPGESLKMLIIADPKDDLAAAYKEGVRIRDELIDREDRLRVDLVSGSVDREFARRHLREYDIVHYTGHAEYDETKSDRSGWVMRDGTWTASEVRSIQGETPFPFLVFSNACHSGRTGARYVGMEYEKEIYDLASTFLHCGVTHYIGTFLEVLDAPGATFAIEFYRSLDREVPIGEAVRSAREQLIRHYGENNIIWASYMLYGDPARTLPSPKPGNAPSTGKTTRAAYAAVFLIIVILIYIGAKSLVRPPLVPDSRVPAASTVPEEPFRISFLSAAGLREQDPVDVREALAEGSRMYMYDQFQFFFKCNRDAHIYFLSSTGPGTAELLLAGQSTHSGNSAESERVVHVDASLLKPDESSGPRFIYILASGQEREDRQQILWEVEKLDERLLPVHNSDTGAADTDTDYAFVAMLELGDGKIRSIRTTAP